MFGIRKHKKINKELKIKTLPLYYKIIKVSTNYVNL